ncbi:MAG: hypothetical protein JKY66_00400 [Spongiibacteraceae bacterium]|nr:hypothetical protein [Spongiibacteraceae bacterium]
MNKALSATNDFGNPNIFGLSAFGFSLFLLGMELVVSRDIAGAALYALLFAGVLELLAGMWMIAKGESYFASILSLFGMWLIGFFLLMTQGRSLGVFNGMSAGWYMLAIVPPVVMLAIPAFIEKKWILSTAFVVLLSLVLALGIGFITNSDTWLFSAGIFAFMAAFFIWWLLWHHIHALITD